VTGQREHNHRADAGALYAELQLRSTAVRGVSGPVLTEHEHSVDSSYGRRMNEFLERSQQKGDSARQPVPQALCDDIQQTASRTRATASSREAEGACQRCHR